MKILVGYEASRVADEALKLAHKHAKAYGADLFIMTSLEQSPALKKEDIDQAESRLEKIKKPFIAEDIPGDHHHVEPEVSHETRGLLVRCVPEDGERYVQGGRDEDRADNPDARHPETHRHHTRQARQHQADG